MSFSGSILALLARERTARLAPSLRAPVMCAALALSFSACSSDDEPLRSEVSPSSPDDGGKPKPDAGSKDAGGKGKPDARVEPSPIIKVDGGVDVEGCGAVRAEAELGRGPVDIIITLDTSLSMAPQVCNVSTNLTAFAAGIGDSSHVISVYEMGPLGLLTAAACGGADPLAATPLAMDPDRYRHHAIMVDSWNALSQLDAQFDTYKDFLRPDAPTHVIVVTDDSNDPLRGGMLGADFKVAMEQKLGHPFFFHSIVADQQNGCVGSGSGEDYIALSDATMGEKLSICATDWSVLFKQLEAAVVNSAPIPCEFDIPAPPAGSTLDPAAVQVVFTSPDGSEEQFPRATSKDQCSDKLGWSYDDADKPTRIELCPAACSAVEAGGNVNIAFGCAPTFVM